MIYEGDTFKYHIENGYKVIDEHIQDFKNIDNEKIAGAYAIVDHPDYTPYVEIMNIAQIKKAWAKGKADLNKANDVHNEFADQMAKKTVINRACKNFINSSDDAYLMETFDRTSNNESIDVVAENVAYDIAANANSVDFEDAEVIENPKPASPQKQNISADEMPTKQQTQDNSPSASDDDIPDFMKG